MSMSSEHFEHHLTPAGWVAGSEQLDFGAKTIVPRPADALLTVNEHRKMSHSMADEEDVSCYEIWRSTNIDAIAQAIASFGALPNISPPFKRNRRR
jgi:hypothetical protein